GEAERGEALETQRHGETLQGLVVEAEASEVEVTERGQTRGVEDRQRAVDANGVVRDLQGDEPRERGGASDRQRPLRRDPVAGDVEPPQPMVRPADPPKPRVSELPTGSVEPRTNPCQRFLCRMPCLNVAAVGQQLERPRRLLRSRPDGPERVA